MTSCFQSDKKARGIKLRNKPTIHLERSNKCYESQNCLTGYQSFAPRTTRSNKKNPGP